MGYGEEKNLNVAGPQEGQEQGLDRMIWLKEHKGLILSCLEGLEIFCVIASNTELILRTCAKLSTSFGFCLLHFQN